MSDDELRKWAEEGDWASPSGAKIRDIILRLLAEKQAHIEASAALKNENEQLKVSLAAFAERVHAQSELLSRRAEVAVGENAEVAVYHKEIVADQVFAFGVSETGKVWINGMPVGCTGDMHVFDGGADRCQCGKEKRPIFARTSH